MEISQLRKVDFEQIAIIVNIFGELNFIVNWKSVKGSPITVKLILDCIRKAMQETIFDSPYDKYLRELYEAFEYKKIDKTI